MINIIQKGTASTVRATADKLQYSGVFMEIPQLTVIVKSPTAIAFEIGDFITWGYDSLTYTLKELPQLQKQATSGSYGEAFVYENMIFKSALADVKYIDFLDVVPSNSTSHFSSLPTFSFYGNVFALIDRLNANLGRLYANWVVQAADVESGYIYDALYTERQVDISSPSKVWDALGLAYSMWGLGWVYYYDTLTSKHTIVIGAEGGATGNFSYGQGNGLYMVGKAITKEDSIVTRLRAYGSTRNMPARYYNNKTILIDRLLIDDPLLYLPNLMIPYTKWQYTGGYPDPQLAYINSNSADVDAADTSYAKYGIRERSIFFDGNNNLKEIYPTIEQITAGEMRAAIAGYSGSQYALYYSPNATAYPDATRLDKVLTGDTLTDDGIIKTDTIYSETATYTTQNGNEVMTTEVITKRFDPIYFATLDNNGEYRITFTAQNLTVTGVNTDIEDGTLRVWVQRNGSRVSLSKTVPATLITGGVEFAMPEIEISVPDGGDIYAIELDMDITIPTLGEGELATIHWVLDSGTATYTLTKVVPNRDFTISLRQIGFDIFKFLSNAGQNPVISMTSGACTGREFQIKRADYVSASDSWLLTCTRQSDTSINQWFPNKNFHIAAEDTFVLLNINMPDILIDIAELRLYDEACKWLRKAKEQQYIYEPKVDEVYMALNPQVIKEGMMMPLTDSDLGISGSKMINSLTINENDSAVRTFEVVLREDTDQDLLKYINAQAKQQSSSAVSSITNATTSTSQSVESLSVSQPTQQTELGYTPENIANKTSVLSSNSTNVQYPNAKATYEYLQTSLGAYIPKTQNVLLKEPTGFKSPESVIITYNSTNRTITLTGTIEGYSNGVLISELVSGWVSSPHPATLDSIYYLYYNGSSIVWSDSFPGFQSLFIAVVYYRTNNPFAQRECHGLMQWQSHLADHYNIGTYRTGGGDITNLILNSTTADNRRPIVSECAIQDEDLLTYNPALTTKKYSQRFISGASTINYTLQANDIVPLLTNNPYYNSFASPNFGQTLMPDNSAMTVWLFEVPVTSDAGSQEIRHAFVQGQSITLAANASPAALATAVSTEKLKSPLELNLGVSTVVASEYVCIHKFIITYSGGNWTITDSIKITGSRASQVGSPSGNYLTAVSTDDTITGNGSVGLPLSIATYAAKKAGDIALPFSASKLTSVTLVVPPLAPTDLIAGQTALYATEAGFNGETPSGAGTLTSVALTMPTGFSVSGSPITESGTFGVTFASGYFLPTTAQFASKLDVSLKGSANGLAELDENGFVKNTQLPSYVDDVLEYDNLAAFPATGESGKIYIAKDTNKTYRWSGTGYAVISETLALGETSSTAYRGDRGKTAYDHSQITSGNPHGTTAADVGALALSGGTLSGNLSFSLDDLGIIFFDGGRIYKKSGTGIVINRGANEENPKIENYAQTALYTMFHEGNLLNIGTSASSARTALELGSAALKSDTYFALLAGSISQPFSASKLASTTLLLPQTTPSLASGEMAIYGLESGFSGETPSGAGSVTSISMVVPTGLSVTPATITESGTFTISYASGYSIPTNTKQSEWDNAYTLRHNAVTLGTANGLSLSTQELSLGLASTTTNGALSSTDWNTFNGKQAKLIGTGASSLVRVNTSGVIAYDDSTYLTGNQTITLSGIITGSGTTAITTAIADGALSIAKTSGLQTALDGKLSTTGKAADSDKLDGQDSTYFATAAQMNAANLSSGYLPYWNGSSLANSTLYYNGANYGIGTTSPTSMLHIETNTWNAGGYIPFVKIINLDVNAADSAGLLVQGGALSSMSKILDVQDYNGVSKFYVLGDGNSVMGGNLAIAGALSGITTLSASNVANVGGFRVSGSSVVGNGVGLEIYYNNSNKSVYLLNYHRGIDDEYHKLYFGASEYSFDVGIVGITNTTQSTAYTNGGLVLSGGLGIAKDLYSNGKAVFASSVQMLENINTNLRIPKVAPTNPVSGEFYIFMVE